MIMKYAGFWRQLGAVIIDQIVVLLPCAVIPEAYLYASVARGEIIDVARYHANALQLVLTGVLLIAYYLFFNGRYGVTLGRRVMNLKLVRLDQPNRDGIGFLRAAARVLLFVAAGGFFRAVSFASLPLVPAVIIDAAAGATIFWLFLDPRRRTLEDMITGTFLVHDPNGKFPDFDPDSLPPAKIRRVPFGVFVVINALASIFIGLNR
jgi:uncharacterized RDD family membrane protein YckC